MSKEVEGCTLSDKDFEKLQLYISEYTRTVELELEKAKKVETLDEWNKTNKIMNFNDWFLSRKGRQIPKKFSCFIKSTSNPALKPNQP